MLMDLLKMILLYLQKLPAKVAFVAQKCPLNVMS